MCILITKPRSAAFPPVEAIQNSVINNPDGFSMAYNIDGELITYKSMSAAQFVAQYRRITALCDPKTTGMIIHARIATHGSVGLKNCHCWKSFVGDSAEMAFAHNGILSVPPRDGMTDSETFLRDYFEPAFVRGSWMIANRVIAHMIGGSKIAFIDRSGNIRKFGYFISDDGCSYSNTSYLGSRFARCADPRQWSMINSKAI